MFYALEQGDLSKVESILQKGVPVDFPEPKVNPLEIINPGKIKMVAVCSIRGRLYYIWQQP